MFKKLLILTLKNKVTKTGRKKLSLKPKAGRNSCSECIKNSLHLLLKLIVHLSTEGHYTIQRGLSSLQGGLLQWDPLSSPKISERGTPFQGTRIGFNR
ncbi:hypothetical protein CDAR_248701 [Caerostris darwini]|uniref:Ycf15 n=1 Tax=Caerostris darwini TaxID=1538125 RepID=A0AAV4MRJ0_9ARAC|nr:hypothetical protein CDAR_248701 [Caerostris darwini]